MKEAKIINIVRQERGGPWVLQISENGGPYDREYILRVGQIHNLNIDFAKAASDSYTEKTEMWRLEFPYPERLTG